MKCPVTGKQRYLQATTIRGDAEMTVAEDIITVTFVTVAGHQFDCSLHKDALEKLNIVDFWKIYRDHVADENEHIQTWIMNVPIGILSYG